MLAAGTALGLQLCFNNCCLQLARASCASTALPELLQLPMHWLPVPAAHLHTAWRGISMPGLAVPSLWEGCMWHHGAFAHGSCVVPGMIGRELRSNLGQVLAGLDARAAAVVMRTVRSIVSTGRTICCTIHQVSVCHAGVAALLVPHLLPPPTDRAVLCAALHRHL